MTMQTSTSSGNTLRGRVWKFGDQVCGDNGVIEFSAIRDGFGKPFDIPLLKEMCFRLLRPEFASTVQPGDLVVGGANFAHHNHVEVSVAIKASGIAAVLVESCESGFIRRALSQGLPVLLVPGILDAVQDSDVISVDPSTGIIGLADGGTIQANPFSPQMVAIWRSGGLVNALAKDLAGA
jgi:3-isopropylmalate/(R)-2-methylmalate dehydratase small subunit